MWVIVISITTGSASFAKDNSNKAAGYAVVVLLYLFSPAYNLGFNGNLGLYIPEILPYPLRTRGLAFFYFVQYCFMILSTFAVPVGLQNIQWRLYIVFVIWIIVEFAGVWFLFPETKGPSLVKKLLSSSISHSTLSTVKRRRKVQHRWNTQRHECDKGDALEFRLVCFSASYNLVSLFHYKCCTPSLSCIAFDMLGSPTIIDI